MLDAERRIRAANPAYFELTGLSEAEVVGKDCGHCHRCWSVWEGQSDLCRHRCPFHHPELHEPPMPVSLNVRGAQRGMVQRAYSHQYFPDGSLRESLLFLFPLQQVDPTLRELSRLDRELRLASEVQTELLQLRREPTPCWEVALASRPYRPVGGDLAETTERLLYVADVSAKSVPAALTLQSVSRAFRHELHGPPERAIARLNRRLLALLPPTMFVAAAVVFVHPGARLTVIHAGLELPWLYRAATRRSNPLERPGMVLGVEARGGHRAVPLRILPRDLLALWSDGFGEALEETGEPLPWLLRRLAAAPSGRLQAAVAQELSQRDYRDDATLLAVRLQPEEKCHSRSRRQIVSDSSTRKLLRKRGDG